MLTSRQHDASNPHALMQLLALGNGQTAAAFKICDQAVNSSPVGLT
jgi:hypothetical protein